MEEIKRQKGRPRKLESEKKEAYTPTGGKRGRPAKARSQKVQKSKNSNGQRGRPRLLRSEDIYIPLKPKNKPYSKSKYAIITKINSGTYDMSYLVGRKVRIKDGPDWLPEGAYYGVICHPGYEGLDMAFDADELRLI
jgi:hypothetical protein